MQKANHNLLKQITTKQLLLILFIAAFSIRLAYIFSVDTSNILNETDSRQYLTFAEEIIEQGISVTNIKVKTDIAGWWGILGPGCPLIIALSLNVFGYNFLPIFILNAIFTSLIVIILYFIGREVFSEKVGIASAIWAIFYYNYWKHSPLLFKESLVYLLLPATVLFIIREIKQKRITSNLFISIFSYIYLIHTDERYVVYSVVFFFAYVFLTRKGINPGIKKAGIWAMGVLLLMIPWLIRNYVVYDQVVILTERTTRITCKLWGDNLGEKHGYSVKKQPPTSALIDSIGRGEMQEDVRGNLLLNIKEGLESGIRPYTFGPIEKYYRAFINFWRPTYFSPSYINSGWRFRHWSLRHNLLGLFLYGVFLPFYAVAIFFLLKNRNSIGIFIFTLPLVQMFIHVMLILTLERYRSPIDCFVVCIGLWVILFFKDTIIAKKCSNKVS